MFFIFEFEVTGKAVMLDEIINYVQSLQRQVEVVRMKTISDSKIFLVLLIILLFSSSP